jgi:hypothetical protein
MAKKPEQPAEHYLKIPNQILNLTGISPAAKNLLAHIYSFGEKGCWQSDLTLGQIFMVSDRTIRRRLSEIKKYLYVKSPKGFYRTFWANIHPDVIAATKLWYRNRQISKEDINNPSDSAKSVRQAGQNCPSDSAKNGFGLGQNCPTTNNHTIKETIKDTTATPTPLPAGRQASALLEDRKAGVISTVEQLKCSLGRGGRRVELTPAERENRKQQQIKALLGDKKNKI